MNETHNGEIRANQIPPDLVRDVSNALYNDALTTDRQDDKRQQEALYNIVNTPKYEKYAITVGRLRKAVSSSRALHQDSPTEVAFTNNYFREVTEKKARKLLQDVLLARLHGREDGSPTELAAREAETMLRELDTNEGRVHKFTIEDIVESALHRSLRLPRYDTPHREHKGKRKMIITISSKNTPGQTFDPGPQLTQRPETEEPTNKH